MRSVVRALALLPSALIPWLLFAPPALAQVPFPLTVTGNSARATVDLPGGFGFELTLTFEQVVGLHPAALDVTATLIDPLDPALLARLPPPPPAPPGPGGLLGGGGMPVPSVPGVGIPAALPVLLRISPPAASALSFEGVYAISLYTHNLQLDPAVPLALYKAHDGGPFTDITVSEGRGSYRAGGSGGDFSEFLIVVDARPIDTVIGEKFAAIDTLLSTYGPSIPPAVLDSLQQRVARARAYYQGNLLVAAIIEMRAFSRYVAAHGGAEIPSVWRANCGPDNVGGLLRSASETLRFSLDRKAGH
jgi:hypothetical protein